MSNTLNFDPLVNAELCGQLLGLNKTRKKEALWDHFVRCIRKTNGVSFEGVNGTVERDGLYDRNLCVGVFWETYKMVHPDADKIAKKKLRGLLMNGCANDKIKSIMGMQALNPNAKLTKKQILAMCCIGGKKVLNMQAKGILLGLDNYPDCTETSTRCTQYGSHKAGAQYDMGGLMARWLQAFPAGSVGGMGLVANDVRSFSNFAKCFYDIPRQNALRKELAMIILQCFGSGNSGLNGLLKLRQLKGKDASSMDLLISSCLNGC